jgi:adenylate cyclase
MRAMPADRDQQFADAGLLEGLDEGARDARLALLRQLRDDGVSLEEMRAAVQEDRLPFLPIDRALVGEARYTPAEIAELAGVPLEYLTQVRRAAGLAVPDPDEPALDENDLEAARISAALRSGGFPEEGLLEVTRALGRGMSQAAAVIRSVAERSFLEPGVTEHELAVRNAEAANRMMPGLGPILENLLRSHLRDQVRRQAITAEELSSGTTAPTREVFVAFVDVVGFTRLGERIGAVTLGDLVGRLAEMAAEVARGDVQLVKTVGDAAMFVGPAAAGVVAAALDLVDRADAAEDFPAVRAGAAGGPAISRDGDWYGSPVNLASRVTNVARPSSVLATREVRDAARDDFTWSSVGVRRLKGFSQPIRLYRARRPAGKT